MAHAHADVHGLEEVERGAVEVTREDRRIGELIG